MTLNCCDCIDLERPSGYAPRHCPMASLCRDEMHSASLDQTTAAGAGGIVASKFAAIAHDWGYSCDVSCDRAPPSGSDRRDAFLARGFLRSFHLPSGLRLCATDQTVVADNRRSGVLGRSLTVMFALEGDPLHYEVEGYGPLTIARGQALAVSSPDSLCLSSRLTTGQRTRSFVLQAQVEHMCDAELAEAVERHLGRTTFQWLPDEARAGFLARALFPSVPPEWLGACARRAVRSNCSPLHSVARRMSRSTAPPVRGTRRASSPSATCS